VKKQIESKRLVLEELHRAFDKQYAASDILDGKLASILNFSSVIVSIVSVIEASSFADKVGFVFWFILATTLCIYVATVWYVFSRGLKPSVYQQPISGDWDELSNQYLSAKEEKVLDLIISEHVTVLEEAEEKNIRKEKVIDRAYQLMVLMVILLLIAVPIGLIFSTSTLSYFLHLASCTIGVKP
jgi:hypothetical protein